MIPPLSPGDAKAGARAVQSSGYCELLSLQVSHGPLNDAYFAWATKPTAVVPTAMPMTARIDKMAFLIAVSPISLATRKRGSPDAPGRSRCGRGWTCAGSDKGAMKAAPKRC